MSDKAPKVSDEVLANLLVSCAVEETSGDLWDQIALDLRDARQALLAARKEGFEDGVEAAAKVCDKRMTQSSHECADAIRSLTFEKDGSK